MSALTDITGQRFGRLTVVGRAPNDDRGQGMWVVRCDCDTDGSRVYAANGANLRRGRIRSCGCLRAEQFAARVTTHGLTRRLPITGSRTLHPLYSIWTHMRSRCHSPKSSGFVLYGAKGVTVCERWRKDFGAFVEDMAERPSPAHSVDRINVKGGYWCGKPECEECGPLGRAPNCRWATPLEQARNTTRTRHITINGVTKCLSEWAREAGMRPGTLRDRLKRMSPEEALRATSKESHYTPLEIHAPYAIPQPFAPMFLPVQAPSPSLSARDRFNLAMMLDVAV